VNDPIATPSLIDRVRRLVTTPTAPFRERWVCATLDTMLREIPGLRVVADRYGNRLVRLRRGNPAGPPAIFVAHLDHPGFLFRGAEGARPNGLGRNTYEAIFEGRVEDRFFPNASVRLFRGAGDPGVLARVVDAHPVDPATDDRFVILESTESAEGAYLGQWNVPAFEHRDGLLHTVACDDLCGAAAMVEALARLSSQPDVDVAMVFTRAEEAGFCGALCLLHERPWPGLLPLSSIFVSVEISSERQGIMVGDGAVIRTGDRSTTFDGPVCDMLHSLAYAQQINARRALMDGGTCEATAFARQGLRAGGICAPVRHYHNMQQADGTLVPEIVSAGDLEALVQLIEGLAKSFIFPEAPTASPIVNDYDLFLRKGRENLESVALGESFPEPRRTVRT